MILGFKQFFQSGTPTFFEEKILRGVDRFVPNYALEPKIHSMREGDRWSPGMSIQMAYGVRTPNYRQFNKGIDILSICISTQDVFMTYNGKLLEITIDDNYYMYWQARQLLIKNDGLTETEFIDWFFKKDFEWSGQIIHWTNFKYEQ